MGIFGKKKIVEETPWREGSTRSILLISDAYPHPLGYTYEDFVVGNQIDWRDVAKKAASMKIKVDTVTITDSEWYRELSAMTNGVSVPFSSGYKTARFVEASISAKGSAKHTYSVTVPAKSTTVPYYEYRMTGESSSASLPSYVTVEGQFSTINKNYWHEHCTNAINLKSNRFSQMAMPESVEYVLTIVVEDANLWVPVQIRKTEPSSAITASSIYTFYSNTARGTYADTSSMTNPDGSSRGSDSNVNLQAAKYSDYTRSTASYRVKFSTLHDTYWNWYNM